MSNKILLDSTGRALLTEDGKVLVAPKSSSGGGVATLLTEITYAELKALRDNSNLVVGQQYRITDYQCTTAEPNTKSGNHQFDIIVVADSSNTLNENARAIQHEGDTYFAESNLSVWELKYDLDNDTTKYAWADEVNGKGVIYWLKDEFNNELPYDFKNIIYIKNVGFMYNQWGSDYTFSRDSSLDADGYYGWRTDRKVNGLEQDYCYTTVETPTTDMTMYKDTAGTVISYGGSITSAITESWEKYTFNVYNTSKDASLKLSETSNIWNVCNNIIPHYYYKQYGTAIPIIKLNWIIFELLNFCYNNTFGNDCHNNTFDTDCYNNTFGSSCYNNIFGHDNHSNTFGNNCTHNIFGSNCYGNTFNESCRYNTFGKDCYNNTFGNDGYNNTFNHTCTNITFGNQCGDITFKEPYMGNIIFENNVSFITLTSPIMNADRVQNVHIHQGVSGIPEEPKVITVARNLDYETTISTVEMQPKLTAGEGITIDENNVISASGGSGGGKLYKHLISIKDTINSDFQTTPYIVEIINSDPTPFTNSTLYAYLKANCNSESYRAKAYFPPITGTDGAGNQYVKILDGIYNKNGSFDYNRYYYKVTFKITDGVLTFNTLTANYTTDTINGMSISSEKVIEL